MTDTITAEHEYGTDGQEGSEAPLGGTLEHLDPTSLAFEDNVRDEADLDKAFLDSIREHGVLTPVTAQRGDDGIVRVRYGQRRTLAARAVGLATIPVYIRPATGGDDTTQLTDRVGQQMVENDHRSDLKDAQRARGIQQLLDAGLSVTKVSKKLSVGKDTVKAAQTAARSATAMDALSSGQLSLMQAAVITEFEEDAEAVSKLIDASGGPRFDHIVAQLRQQREEAKAYAEAAESYAAQGYRVLDDRPDYRDADYVELRWLRTAEGDEVTEEAITDPAHWAVWLDEETSYVDRQSGEPVDEGAIDFYTEHHADEEPADGLRHFSTVIEKAVFGPVWYCIDHHGAGLELVGFMKERKARAEASRAYAAQGYRVLDRRPGGRDTEYVELRWLRTAEGDEVTEEAITDPAQWAVWLDEETTWVDRESGEAVDEEAIDFATEDDPDTQAEEGLRHFSTVIEKAVLVPVWYCIDHHGAGLQPQDGHGADEPVNPGEDPEEARARREAEAAEAASRERKKVLNLNKLGAAAAGVRRQFVTTMLARKTLPKGAATFVADCLARDSYMLTQHNRDEVTAELLGIDAAAIHTAVSDLPAGSDNRALVITLGLVLGSLEARTGKDAWRTPAPARKPGEDRIYYGRSVTSGDYLRFLAANGYTLATVEEVITGTRTADDAYDTYLSDKENSAPDDQ